MNIPKGETRQELLNRAFIYIIAISFAVIIFLRVRSLLFDLFVAVVLAALAEPIVYRLSKKSGRKFAAFFTVVSILLIITGILFSIIPVMVEELYFLSTQLPTYLDNILIVASALQILSLALRYYQFSVITSFELYTSVSLSAFFIWLVLQNRNSKAKNKVK